MCFALSDWIIIILYLLLMLLIGYLNGKKNKTADDYILGNRAMSPFMVGVSLFATLFSTLSYLSYPGEMIKYGPVFLAGILAFPVAGWIVGKYLIPLFLKMNVKSAYEILEIKVGKNTRNLSVVFFLCLRMLWMTTIIYATVDTALVPIFGIDRSLVPLISIALSLFTAVYTTLGGLETVIRTDFIQSLIMFLGLIVAIGTIVNDAGSLDYFFDSSLYSHWQPVRWCIDPVERMTVGNIFIMTLAWQVCTAGSDQMAIQRYLSTGNAKEAVKSYHISLAGSGLIQVLLAVTGVAVIVYFTLHPGLQEGESIFYNSADSLFPLFIRVGLPVGFTGLIASAIMGAAMSSLSSGLNSCSTVILEDVIKKRHRVDNEQFLFSDLAKIKVISFTIGIIVALLSFLIPHVPGNLFDVIQKVVNLVVSPLFVLFFMALFIPLSTDKGTVTGGIVSLTVAAMISFFEIFGIKSLWIMPASLMAGVITGIFVSLVEKRVFAKMEK